MKEQQLQDYINGIRDEFILEAQPRAMADLSADRSEPAVILHTPAQKSRPRMKKRWIPLVVAAAMAVTVGLNLGLYSGIMALTNPGSGIFPSGSPSDPSAPSAPGGSGFGDLFGSLFPFLSPETQPPHEVTIRDLDDVTEPPPPPDTRTECQKGNHEWVFSDPGDATCYRVGGVIYTCSSCEETKTESEKIPHVHEDGYCTVCGMIEGAWEEVVFTLSPEDPNHLTISDVTGDPEGTLILPNLSYDPSTDRFVPVTEIGKTALAKLDKITEVVIPDTVTRFGDSAFIECRALERVNFPEGLTSIGHNAFRSCSSLLEAHLPDSVTELGGSVFTNCTALVSATLPASFDTVPGSIYENCKSLTDVTLKGSIKTVGGAAFMGCISLKQLPDMPELEVIGSSAFEDCESLTEVTLPATLRELGHEAFVSCGSLKKVTIEAPSLYGIYTRVFWGCISLEEITLPKIVGVFSGEEMFSQCNALTIYYPGTREEWQQNYGLRWLELPLNTKVIFMEEETTE